MHSQKISILGGAMVEKNHFFSDSGPSNQSELLCRVLHIFVCSTLIDSIHQSREKINKNWPYYAFAKIFDFRWCHGGKIIFFRIQDQVTKVSCCAEYCTSLCAVLSFIPSINQEKKIKTDHVMHSQKFSILGGVMVEKNHFFFSEPGPSNQSELLRRVLHIIGCSTLIDSIHQSREKK